MTLFRGNCPECGAAIGDADFPGDIPPKCEACQRKSHSVSAPKRGTAVLLGLLVILGGGAAVLAGRGGLAFLSSAAPPVEQANVGAATAATDSTDSPFDVPAICGLTIDEVRKVLGRPNDENPDPTKTEVGAGFVRWDNFYQRGNHVLVLTFNVKTRNVEDLFIVGEDIDRLVSRWRLSWDSPTYRLEAKRRVDDPQQFTGIRVIAVPPADEAQAPTSSSQTPSHKRSSQ